MTNPHKWWLRELFSIGSLSFKIGLNIIFIRYTRRRMIADTFGMTTDEMRKAVSGDRNG